MLAVDSPFDNDEYTVAWICPLSTEKRAAELMLDKKHGRPRWTALSDHNTYTLGETQGHKVVIAGLPSGDIGTASAVTVASQLASSFRNIRFGILIGIGGGVPGPQERNPDPDIRLGDVVVGDPEGDENGGAGIIQHDMGKSTESGFVRTGHFNKAPRALRAAVASLKEDDDTYQLHDLLIGPALKTPRDRKRFARPAEDLLFYYEKPIEREARFERDEGFNPYVHYGTIASGNQLVRDAKKRDEIRSMCKNVLCIEMEAAGLLHCEFPYLVVRGISDYCDNRKDDVWKPYAAMTAVSYATLLLSRITPQTISREDSSAQSQMSSTMVASPTLENSTIFAKEPVRRALTHDSEDSSTRFEAQPPHSQPHSTNIYSSPSLDSRYPASCLALPDVVGVSEPKNCHRPNLQKLSQDQKDNQVTSNSAESSPVTTYSLDSGFDSASHRSSGTVTPIEDSVEGACISSRSSKRSSKSSKGSFLGRFGLSRRNSQQSVKVEKKRGS